VFSWAWTSPITGSPELAKNTDFINWGDLLTGGGGYRVPGACCHEKNIRENYVISLFGLGAYPLQFGSKRKCQESLSQWMRLAMTHNKGFEITTTASK